VRIPGEAAQHSGMMPPTILKHSIGSPAAISSSVAMKGRATKYVTSAMTLLRCQPLYVLSLPRMQARAKQPASIRRLPDPETHCPRSGPLRRPAHYHRRPRSLRPPLPQAGPRQPVPAVPPSTTTAHCAFLESSVTERTGRSSKTINKPQRWSKSRPGWSEVRKASGAFFPQTFY
jgi:hypothetical protein